MMMMATGSATQLSVKREQKGGASRRTIVSVWRRSGKMVQLSTLSTSVFLLALLGTGRANSLSKLIDDSNNQFALDFYQAIRNNPGNIIASPVSLKIVLAIVHQGAEGATAAEIAKVLHHPNDNTKIPDAYKALITELQNPVLKTANKVFVENSFKIHPNFQNVATTYFLSNIQGINFKGDPEGSRKEINTWVENNTNNKIKNLFIKDSLTSGTKLALVNAIHFKAKWLHRFKEENTKDEPFYITPSQTVNAKMMSLYNKDINYKDSRRLEAQMVELPYEIKGFRMILILPHKHDGLDKVESKLVSSDLFTELQGMASEKANVQMPKFKLEKQMDLEAILQKLGMPRAFSNEAEFSKMSNDHLKIDKVVQKAFIEVNEEGTEAAAATGVGISLALLPIVQEIRFDHPFIFLVMKDSTILFMGRVSKPE